MLPNPISGPLVALPTTKAQNLAARNAAKRASGQAISKVVIGTSIDAGTDAVAGASENTTWTSYAMSKLAAEGYKILLADDDWKQAVGGATWTSSNSGASGSYQNQLLAALAFQPDVIVIGGMVNDRTGIWQSGVCADSDFVTALGYLKTMADACVAAGVFPFFIDDCASNNSNQSANSARFQRIVATWCKLHGYGYACLYPTIARPQDGTNPSGTFSFDNTHPNQDGAARLAAEYIRVIKGEGRFSPFMQFSKADYSNTSGLVGANIIQHGCPVNSSTGLADTTGWSTSGSGAAITARLTSATQGYSGGMIDITRNATSGDFIASIAGQNFSTVGAVAGTTRFRCGGRYESDVEGTGSLATLDVQHAFTRSQKIWWGNRLDVTDCQFQFDSIPDVGSTSLRVRGENDYAGSGGATGVVSIGNVAMVNMDLIDSFLQTNGFA